MLHKQPRTNNSVHFPNSFREVRNYLCNIAITWCDQSKAANRCLMCVRCCANTVLGNERDRVTVSRVFARCGIVSVPRLQRTKKKRKTHPWCFRKWCVCLNSIKLFLSAPFLWSTRRQRTRTWKQIVENARKEKQISIAGKVQKDHSFPFCVHCVSIFFFVYFIAH